MADSQFSKLFQRYCAVRDTIHAILREGRHTPVDIGEIERRVREAHPELDMGPVTLVSAIKP
jgi:hypothetical protein